MWDTKASSITKLSVYVARLPYAGQPEAGVLQRSPPRNTLARSTHLPSPAILILDLRSSPSMQFQFICSATSNNVTSYSKTLGRGSIL